ncbi:MAG: TM2 domain-containing protein [Spirochaetaceae bacterium]|nr:TM2 domain-containing protein [Spirochaetaceae bacterium]MBO5236302.1 TM2 domain-containing protein [Spirochaetaceae bacterium]
MEQNENQVGQTEEVSKKSRLVALLLSIFLGNIGIHDFYVGRIGRGIVKAVISVLSLIMYVFAFIMMISLLATSYDTARIYGDIEMIPIAVLMVCALLMLFALGIWVIIDIILCATGNFKDKEGKKITLWETKK